MTAVSVCLITRDEAGQLEGCLASLQPWVDEICLLDTGSTDDTVAIARRCGARVETTVWQSDFSLARNAALALARHPWILVIDADERLDPATGPALRRAIGDPERLAFLVDQVNLRPTGAPVRVPIARLFRNRPDIRFSRPVHESVMDSLFALGARTLEPSGVSLLHDGYTPEAIRARRKHERNLAIMRRHHAEVPDDLYNAYKLAITLPSSAEDERRRVLERAGVRLRALTVAARAELPFLPGLLDAEITLLIRDGRLGDAITAADQAVAQHPGVAQLAWRRADLARRAGDYQHAEALLLTGRTMPAGPPLSVDDPDGLRARWATSLLALAFEAVRPALAREPIDPSVRERTAVRIAELRLQLAEGRLTAAGAGLGTLLASHASDPEVRLLGGELAWMSGDAVTARALWSTIDPATGAGHRASAWLALLSLQSHEPVAALPAPRDVPSAAMTRLVAAEAGGAGSIDPAFDEAAVAMWIARWRQALAPAEPSPGTSPRRPSRPAG